MAWIATGINVSTSSILYDIIIMPLFFLNMSISHRQKMPIFCGLMEHYNCLQPNIFFNCVFWIQTLYIDWYEQTMLCEMHVAPAKAKLDRWTDGQQAKRSLCGPLLCWGHKKQYTCTSILKCFNGTVLKLWINLNHKSWFFTFILFRQYYMHLH